MVDTDIDSYRGENVLDSRQLQEALDELEQMQDAHEEEPVIYDPLNADEQELLEAIEALSQEADTGEWPHGITFISEDYFEDYAREFAEDIGAIDSDARWPATCIDWERAADELKMDYSTAEFLGTTYYYR